MGSHRSLAKSVSAVVVICALSGCSLAIDAPDPQRPRNEVPKCDTGKGAVAMDGLLTTILGVASIAAFANDESGTGLVLGAMGGLFVASAIRGNTAANECRAAYTDYNLAYQQGLLRDERQTPVPVVAKKRPAKPKPPPVVTQLPEEEQQQPAGQIDVEPVAPTPARPERVEPYSTPRPPPVKKPVTPPAKPAATDDDEDWSSFWTEAP